MKKKMTSKQKIALWALIKFPGLNDREVSEKIRLKLSTLTTIRYKMIDDGYYKTVNVPIVNRLAYGVCGFFLLRLKPGAKGNPFPIKKGELPNLVYIAHDPNRIMAFGFYPDLAAAEADLHAMASKLVKNKALARSGHWWRFLPLENNEFPAYFEMSSFVNKGVGLNRPEAIQVKGSIFKGEPIHLSSFERKVFRELIAYPDETDVHISKKLKVTRSTVARIRERLIGLAYRTLNIVDLSKLRYKAISIAAPTLDLSFTGSKNSIRNAAVSIEVPLFLSVGPYGALYMTAHKELKGIRNKTNKVFRGGEFKDHIQEPSHIATFNLKQLKVLRNHEYLPLVNQMLDRYGYKPKRRKKKRSKKKKR